MYSRWGASLLGGQRGGYGYHSAGHWPSLDYHFLLDSASPITDATHNFAALTKTIASNAMSFNSDGNVAYAPHQLLENANLGTRTGDLPSGWAWTTETGSIAWTDPGDYSQGVFTVSTQRQELLNNVTVVASETYTAFAYISESAITSGTATILAVTGTNGTDGDITDTDWDSLGGVAGWYAVGFTMGAADTSAALTIGAGVGGNAVGSVTIERPGVVKGLLPGVGVNSPAKLAGEPLGRWIGTDDGDEPLYDQPRFTHDPANGNARLGLLEEMGAATNDILQSAAFDNASWTKRGTAAVVANDAVAPDGNTTADKLTINTGSNDIFQQVSGLTADATQSPSFYIKKVTASGTLEFLNPSSAANGDWDIDLSVLGSGWERITLDHAAVTENVAFTATAGSSAGLHFRSASGELVFHCWGAQSEEADKPSSHIPTTTASATRAKDIRTAGVDWLNANAGTMFKQAIIEYAGAAEMTLWSIDDGSVNDRLRLYMDAAENVNFETVNSGDNDGASDGAAVIAANTVFKAAGVYADDDVIGYVDGTASAADSSAGLPVGSTATTSRWGDDSAGGTPWAGITQREIFWPVRLPGGSVDRITT